MGSQVPQLQLHQIRVIEEKSELDGRLRHLSDFIESTTFTNLSASECALLVHQAGLMAQLSEVLGQRIGLWTRK